MQVVSGMDEMQDCDWIRIWNKMISSSNENTVSEHMFYRCKDSNPTHKLPYITLKQVILEERIN